MRKYFWFLLWMVLFSAFTPAIGQVKNAGLDKLPPEIKSAFIAKYAETSEISYSVIDQEVLVSFKSGDEYYDAFFDQKGKWLRTETAIVFDQLPNAIQDSLKNGEFATWQKGSIFEVKLPGNVSNFKIFVYSKDWNEMEINFDKNGKRIN